jgi:hypothetical protein
MRILLQDISSRRFYRGRGQWTADRSDALDLQFAGGTAECLEEIDLVDVELVVEGDSFQPALSI